METATVSEQATPYEQPDEPERVVPAAEQVEAAAEQPAAKLFQWSAWVHVGDGAEQCDRRFTGKCEDDGHFHAWCRIPNALQNKDITEKALAAKARRQRALRDPQSDAYAIFETDLEELTEADREQMIGEASNTDINEVFQAQADTIEREEFKHYHQDREEWLRLLTVDPDERNAEEFSRLQEEMDQFDSVSSERLAEIRRPKREALQGLDFPELLERVRKVRIENWTNLTYHETFNYWTWYVGTLKPSGVKSDGSPRRPTERYYSSIEQLKSAPTEVLTELGRTFSRLREGLNKGTISGNS